MKDNDLVALNEDDLDGIVGGAINAGAAQALGLAVGTRNGHLVMTGTITTSTGTFPNCSSFSKEGLIAEKHLKNALDGGFDNVSAVVDGVGGTKVELNREQLQSLIS